jgi:hypothetical protein
MDVEAWIIAQLEPTASGRDSWAEVTMDGPCGLAVQAAFDWFEADDGGECCGVGVAVSLGAEPGWRSMSRRMSPSMC